ncbi:hypothetical protein OCOL_001607 [Ordospora colligata]|uniref:RING-finger domain-containing ubiquitin ligase n=1 Tax=Ordospora colligata OC4 TaxID=1354746 RepID=A0A0B2UJA7_9MICR|nr:RING-finger domain-containing ubiquitin ligase [Ordospora colligata OC4]KHN69289.1 RING-finger domain-containing ubiquitin ligase [Ordospora colligata OC4]TBU15105.1 RING-finger domain-containing ubiquitin ligase [Ordospora colligata]
MARREGNNNFIDIMRSMLRFLEGRMDSVDGSSVHSGAFVDRLRSRLSDLIRGRVENNSENRASANESATANTVSSRRNIPLSGNAPNAEEREIINRCNRIINVAERELGRARGRRQNTRSADNANAQEYSNIRNPFVLRTSVVVTGNGRSPLITGSANEQSNDTEGSTANNLENTNELSSTPTHEVHVLFLSPNEMPRGGVIYEIQINFDILDGSSEMPMTATKESLNKSTIVKARAIDETQECTICMCNFARKQKLRELPCEHKFHMKCVDKWLLSHSNKCPVCRTVV